MALTPECRCPSCGKLIVPMDDDAKPAPGHITLCLHCGHLMAFDTDMALRELTAAEAHALAGDKTILALQRLRGEVMKK